MCPLIGLDIWLSVPHFSQSTYQSTIKKRKEKKKKKKPVSVCGLFVFSEVWSLKRSRLCVQCEYWMHDCLLKAALLLWGFLNVHWIVFCFFFAYKNSSSFPKGFQGQKKNTYSLQRCCLCGLAVENNKKRSSKGQVCGQPSSFKLSRGLRPPQAQMIWWGRGASSSGCQLLRRVLLSTHVCHVVGAKLW